MREKKAMTDPGHVPAEIALLPCLNSSFAMCPSLAPGCTVAMLLVLFKVTLNMRSSWITRCPFSPPRPADEYECPPDFAETLSPDARPQLTAAWICGMVVGTATAAGVNGRRELKGLISAVQVEDPALSAGTEALLKQSSIAARLENMEASLKTATRQKTKRVLRTAMIRSREVIRKADQLRC
jgi:hypothetical protein